MAHWWFRLVVTSFPSIIPSYPFKIIQFHPTLPKKTTVTKQEKQTNVTKKGWWISKNNITKRKNTAFLFPPNNPTLRTNRPWTPHLGFLIETAWKRVTNSAGWMGFWVALPETNSSHLKIDHPNRKIVFQPFIFRGELLVWGRVHRWILTDSSPLKIGFLRTKRKPEHIQQTAFFEGKLAVKLRGGTFPKTNGWILKMDGFGRGNLPSTHGDFVGCPC